MSISNVKNFRRNAVFLQGNAYQVPPNVLNINKPAGSCMICKNTKYLKNLDKAYFQTNSVLDMFITCFHIKIVDEPSTADICITCVSRLTDANAFRKQVEAMDISFNQIITKSNPAKKIIKEVCTPQKTKKLKSLPYYNNDFHADKTNLNDDNVQNKIVNNCDQQTQNADSGLDLDSAVNAEYSSDDSNEIKSDPNRKEWYDQKINLPKPVKVIFPTLDPTATSCPVCDEAFDEFIRLVSHFENHFPNYLCEACGKTYVWKTAFLEHMATHNNTTYSCPHCSKIYKVKNSLSQHVKTYHSGMKLYTCPKCPERFSTIVKRRKHMDEVHGIALDKYFCNICPVHFYSSYYLDKHTRRVHLKEKTVQCTECDKAFFSANLLKKHMITHSDERNFPCEYCGKAFKVKKSLRIHTSIHSNSRSDSHVCELCGKTFNQTASLKSHMISHHKTIIQTPNAKSFHCDPGLWRTKTDAAATFSYGDNWHF